MLYASWVLATIALFVPFVFLPAYVAIHGGDQVAEHTVVAIGRGKHPWPPRRRRGHRQDRHDAAVEEPRSS